jgi:DNA polymerase/3'-5' exonuclease PolX
MINRAMTPGFEINRRIAGIFYKKSRFLQEKGDRYKYRALSYIKAARAIERLDKGVNEIYKKSWLAGLQKIDGIGNRLAHEIENELKREEFTKK